MEGCRIEGLNVQSYLKYHEIRWNRCEYVAKGPGNIQTYTDILGKMRKHGCLNLNPTAKLFTVGPTNSSTPLSVQELGFKAMRCKVVPTIF